MRILCIVLALLCLILLFSFWASRKVETLCTKMQSLCQTGSSLQALTFWERNKKYFSLAVNRSLLKELEIRLYVWQSSKDNSSIAIEAKQSCERILENIKEAYGICFVCAL